MAITPDCVVSASDGIFFYINSHLLSHVGAHALPVTPLQRAGELAPAGPVTRVSEDSRVLTILFCAIYGIPCNSIAPSLEDIFTAINRMSPNGMDPKILVRNGTPLHGLLVTYHAPYQPLRVFSFVAHHGLESLAQVASSHLLNLDLNDVDEASAIEMGSLYLKRLALVIISRTEALKRIIIETPPIHPLARGCNEEIQKAMRKEWERTATHLTWEVRPGALLSAFSRTLLCRALTSTIPFSQVFPQTY